MESIFSSLRTSWWRSKDTKTLSKPHIIVSWNKDQLIIDFDTPEELRSCSLRDVKTRLRDLTGVAMNSMKIVYSGAVLKDDGAALGFYGVDKGANVTLIGVVFDATEVAMLTTDGDKEEMALIAGINKLYSSATNLLLEIEQFESTIATSVTNEKKQIVTDSLKDHMLETYRKLSEKLLQILISLDAIESPIEFTQARKRRRECVKFTQGLLDRVDKVKNDLLL